MNRYSLPRHPFLAQLIAAGTAAGHAWLRSDHVHATGGLRAPVT